MNKSAGSFFYPVVQGIKNVFKNAVMSVASVLTLTCCLLVLGSFYTVLDNLNENAKAIDKLNQIVVTLDRDLPRDKAKEVFTQASKLPNISKCVFKTKEESLDDLRNDENAVEIIPNINYENNPIPDKIIITFDNVNGAGSLVYQLEKLEGVDKVSDKLTAVRNIDMTKKGITVIAAVLMAILMVVSLFVIVNMIKLTVFTRREEIDIMRCVGSTSFFITMPFIVEGAFIGLISATVAFGLQFCIYKYVFTDIAIGYDLLMKPFGSYAAVLAIAFFAVSIITGVAASGISAKHYAKE